MANTTRIWTTYAEGEAPSAGTALWQQFLVIAAVVGFLAAVQQLWKWLRNRKLDRAQEEALRIIAKQLDAEGSRLKAEHYERLLLTLRSQVEREVPRQARSAYLASRVNALAANIARDFDEYESAKHELTVLENQLTTELDASIADVVRREISPTLSAQRRVQLLTVVAIGLVLVASVVPFNLYTMTERALYYAYPAAWYSLADPVICVLWMTCVLSAFLGIGVYASPTRLHLRLSRSRIIAAAMRRRKLSILGMALLGLLFLGIGLVLGSISIQEQTSWGQVLEVNAGLAVGAWLVLIVASFVLATTAVATATAMASRSRASNR